MVEEELDQGETDPFDTHPSLKDRIAALGTLEESSTSDEGEAILLLTDPPGLEQSLFPGDGIGTGGSRLKPIEWEDVGNVALVPMYREILQQNRQVLRAVTPAGLPLQARRLMDLKHELFDEDGERIDLSREEYAEIEDPGSRGAPLAGMSLVLTLTAHGWNIDWLPGDEITLRNGEEVIKPFSVVEDLLSGAISPDDWRATIERAGIAEADLSQLPT
jgi:hypothetical protein